MSVQDIVAEVARKNGVDEVMVISTSKLEVKEWVGERCRWLKAEPLSTAQARIVLREYGECALVVGKDALKFREQLQAIEHDLRKKGHYKAWAIINEPLGQHSLMPCHEFFCIDIIATLRRYKKNLQLPEPGDYAPWGIILIE